MCKNMEATQDREAFSAWESKGHGVVLALSFKVGAAAYLYFQCKRKRELGGVLYQLHLLVQGSVKELEVGLGQPSSTLLKKERGQEGLGKGTWGEVSYPPPGTNCTLPKGCSCHSQGGAARLSWLASGTKYWPLHICMEQVDIRERRTAGLGVSISLPKARGRMPEDAVSP